MKNILNQNERATLEFFYQTTKDKWSANKANTLLLLDDGYTSIEVSAILRIDDDTVRRYAKSFIDLGISKYLEHPFSGGVCRLDSSQLDQLGVYMDEHLCQSTTEPILFVKTNFGIDYTEAGMAALLKRQGFVYKKPVKIPSVIDVEIQIAFIEYYEKIKSSMTAKDKLYFIDGVHPQFNSVSTYGWMRKGEERTLKSNTGRERLNINGALDPNTLEVIARFDETLNASSTIELFKDIERENPEAKKIALIVDNARYYYNGEVMDYINQSKKLELIFLPPYCPNLNLIERLWRYMRKKVINNQYYSCFDDFKLAVGNFFLKLPDKYDELSKLITENFQIITERTPVQL